MTRLLRISPDAGDPRNLWWERAMAARGLYVTGLPLEGGGWSSRTTGRTSRLGRLVERLDPQVVELELEPGGPAARRWLRALPAHLPVVGHSDRLHRGAGSPVGVLPEVRLPVPVDVPRAERIALNRYSLITAATRSAADRLRARGFAGPTEVLPPGVDLAVFRPGRQRPPRAELGEGAVLGVVGPWCAASGVLDAVRVLATMRRDATGAGARSMPTRLLVVGEGPQERAIRLVSEALRVDDQVERVTALSPAQLANQLRRMHVLLIPALDLTGDDADLVAAARTAELVARARACGVVVVAYATGALPEVVDGVGRVVRPGDTAAMAAVVGALLHDPAGWLRLRSAGLVAGRALDRDTLLDRQAELYRAMTAAPTSVAG